MASLSEYFDGDCTSLPIGTRVFSDGISKCTVVDVLPGPLFPGKRREHVLSNDTVSLLYEFDMYAFDPCTCIDRLEFPVRRYYERTCEYPPEFFSADPRFLEWALHFVRIDGHIRWALQDPEFPVELFLAKVESWSNSRIRDVLAWAFQQCACESVRAHFATAGSDRKAQCLPG